MNLDGEFLGWAVASQNDDDDDDDVSPSSLAPRPDHVQRGSFPLKHGVQEHVAVFVGKIVSPPPRSHCPRTEPQLNVSNDAYSSHDVRGAGANAMIHSDTIPRKSHRGSSERAIWQAARSHLVASPSWRCHPQQASLATSSQDPVIEVAPGVELTLRGSQETWEAIVHDFYVPGLCWECSETIFVIQDAAYVLCPTCRTVSPMDGTFEHPEISGVGLGFTFEELAMWQQQIADERKRKPNK